MEVVYVVPIGAEEKEKELGLWLRLKGCCVLETEGVLIFDDERNAKLRHSLVGLSDSVWVCEGWKNDEKAKLDIAVAKSFGKKVHFVSKQWSLRSGKVADCDLITENGEGEGE